MAPLNLQNANELHPLKSLEDLFDWKVPAEHIDEIVYGRKLQPRYPPYDPGQLKTLICHDMKGGYLDDRFCSGTCNDNSYRFYNWSGVDLFVYFSHNLVTIPPPCWVDAAHLHGVKVLGTFITEWDVGSEICQKMLSNEESIKKSVSILVEIAKYHNFEGWLINIENVIDSEKVDALVDFVQQLTVAMKEMCLDAVVLWYDSVTKDGELKWQNELNDLNRCFFDVCDGIFLNYTWTSDHLQRSHKVAGERNSDVFVGLDVFGRNFYKGGKFNTNEALELARANELSAAIFAQGWTYETQENFEEAEDKLWRSLSPYLFHHGPRFLPFKTSFCQGVGRKKFTQGKLEETKSWYNLCKQQYQPIWPHDNRVTMKMVTNEAFDGSGALQINTTCQITTRLFVCEINWKTALLVSIIYKNKEVTVPLSLVIQFTIKSDDEKMGKQRTAKLPLADEEMIESVFDSTGSSFPCDTIGIEKVVDNELEGWQQRTFTIPDKADMTVTEISLQFGAASTVLIGQLHVSNVCRKGAKD